MIYKVTMTYKIAITYRIIVNEQNSKKNNLSISNEKIFQNYNESLLIIHNYNH